MQRGSRRARALSCSIAAGAIRPTWTRLIFLASKLFRVGHVLPWGRLYPEKGRDPDVCGTRLGYTKLRSPWIRGPGKAKHLANSEAPSWRCQPICLPAADSLTPQGTCIFRSENFTL
jgi:hypothetical protein